MLCLFGHVEQRLRALEADLFLQFLRPQALPGAELSAIASRGSVAEAPCLQESDGNTGACEVERRLKAGKAAADNGDVDRDGAVQGRIGRPLAACRLVPGLARR